MNWRKGSLVMRLSKRVLSLLKNHPDTSRRCKRLAHIAAQKGYSPASIRTALYGPIDISALSPQDHGQSQPAIGENRLVCDAVQTDDLYAVVRNGGTALELCNHRLRSNSHPRNETVALRDCLPCRSKPLTTQARMEMATLHM